MDALGPILLFALFLIFALCGILWHFSRFSSLLQQWAEQNEYRLIDKEYRTFFRGPFFWTTSKGQTVYYVTVEDDEGRIRRGWVRCGGWFLGLMSDNVEVRWDD